MNSGKSWQFPANPSKPWEKSGKIWKNPVNVGIVDLLGFAGVLGQRVLE